MDLDPRAYLVENDSYTFFERTRELLRTGPTNTNVNDLLFVMVYCRFARRSFTGAALDKDANLRTVSRICRVDRVIRPYVEALL